MPSTGLQRALALPLIALLVLLPLPASSTRASTGASTGPPPGSKIYPALNFPNDDAWVIPVGGTSGKGQLIDRSAHLQFAVLTGYIGTNATDDRCSSPGFRQSKGKGQPYTATFELSVRNSSIRRVILHPSDFSLFRDGTKEYPMRLAGPAVYFSFTVPPRSAKRQYLAVDTLPPGRAIYHLRFRASRKVSWYTIGMYRVVPNGKNPCSGR